MDIDILVEASMNNSTPKLPRCIFRVPEVLRRHNVLAYAPDIVSIGPYHPRDNVQFQAMENLKYEYLRNLLLRMDRLHDRDMNLKASIDKLIGYIFQHKNLEAIHAFEKKARDFYAHPFDPPTKMGFLHMMILDGCFLVQICMEFIYTEHRDINNPLFNMDCMFRYICHDLLLLENQIPWFVLQSIYELSVNPTHRSCLSALILTALSSQPQLSHNCRWYLDHLGGNNNREDESVLHILDLIRTSIVFSFTERFRPFHGAKIQLIASATALSEAGIRFKRSSDECKSIMDIRFEHGVIMIPPLEIGEWTESIFRNLIALEQCCYGRSHKITAYAVLMDNLLGSSNDIKFLRDKEIIGNWLSAENGSEFFSKLHCDTVLTYFYYDELCAKVKDYPTSWVIQIKTALKSWGEIFFRNYCSNPWKAASWIVAVIILILTVVQTAYTIKQYYSSRA